MGFGRKDMTGSADTFDDFGGVVTKARYGKKQFGNTGSWEKGLHLTIRKDNGFDAEEVWSGGKDFGEPSEDGLSFTGTVAHKSKIDHLVIALEELLGTEIKGEDPRELEGINAHWSRKTINLGKDKADKTKDVTMKVLLPTKLRAKFVSRAEASAEQIAAVETVIKEALGAGSVTKGALIGKIYPKLVATLGQAKGQEAATLAADEQFLGDSARPWKYENQTLAL